MSLAPLFRVGEAPVDGRFRAEADAPIAAVHDKSSAGAGIFDLGGKSRNRGAAAGAGPAGHNMHSALRRAIKDADPGYGKWV